MVTLRLDEVKNSIKLVLSYVLLNILLTLSIWYFVYDAKYGIDVFYYNFLLDIEGSHFSTGDKFFDGIFNGLLIAAYIVVLSFLLIACVLYKFKRVVVVFIHCSFLILSIVMPGTIFKDFSAKYFGLDNQLVVVAIVFATLLYASAATLSLFTDRFPPIFRQMFAITNCASVSVYYLRLLPRHTIWFLLLAVIFWDMFAVKSSFGPLKLAIQNSQDYSEGLLRFVTLTVQKGNNDDDDDASSLPSSSSLDSHHSFSVASASTSAELVQLEEEEEVESSNDEYEEAIITTTNNSGTQVKEERTAYDVLNDGNWTTLGTGDLIIYGLFVGKALESGSQLAVIAAIIGVLVGLILTLSISSDSDDDSLESDYVPALPLPLSIGMIVYFGALFAEKAFHQTALSGTAITL